MRFNFGRPVAVAHIKGGREFPLIKGNIQFYQLPSGVLLQAEISGLPNSDSGFFGFHIHDGAVCAGPSFSATGLHYSRVPALHPRHSGDLPPLLSYNGNAYMAVITDRFSISEVMGRTVVIHSKQDDFKTQPAGNAGDKIACGVIQRR